MSTGREARSRASGTDSALVASTSENQKLSSYEPLKEMEEISPRPLPGHLGKLKRITLMRIVLSAVRPGLPKAERNIDEEPSPRTDENSALFNLKVKYHVSSGPSIVSLMSLKAKDQDKDRRAIFDMMEALMAWYSFRQLAVLGLDLGDVDLGCAGDDVRPPLHLVRGGKLRIAQ